MSKIRRFEEVSKKHKTIFDIFTDEKGSKHKFPKDIKLPTRNDSSSAGYDFYIPKDVELLPRKQTIVLTDVKAYMQEDEVLNIYIRSSLATKHGIQLSNNVGVIDASYYNNPDNDGNIGLCLHNTSGRTVVLEEGSRVAQGIFTKYLITDDDVCTSKERSGGFGSSGE